MTEHASAARTGDLIMNYGIVNYPRGYVLFRCHRDDGGGLGRVGHSVMVKSVTVHKPQPDCNRNQ